MDRMNNPANPEARVNLGRWPCFSDEQIEAAVEVLRSGAVNYWTGEQGRTFEREYAASLGVKHAVAVSSGTAALEIALRALGIGPGDEVITTCRTFIASASCIVAVGATPVLADVDLDSQNVTAESIQRKITPRTKAIIAVHLAGWPCDMDPILDLAKSNHLAVIEDCAQAHGARYKGRPVGSMGDINAFSFCQDKIMTTAGEGGLVTTNSDALWEKVWAYKDHGKSFDAVYKREHSPGFRWLHESFGTNMRMTEVQAAVGRVALRHLDEWVTKRRQNADSWKDGLKNLKAVRLTLPPDSIYHSYYKYYVFIVPAMLRPDWSRDRIMCEINDAGVPCSVGSCSEIYLERAFESAGIACETLPNARELGLTSLMFQVHPTLSEEDTRYMIGVARNVIAKATR
jgi:dTDP-4-amino-4,6-dideoxygalactose transaminase